MFFFPSELGKLQNTPLKFGSIWISHSEILKFGFDSLTLHIVLIITLSISFLLICPLSDILACHMD